MYNYYPPPGYGDTFFQYVFDAQIPSSGQALLTNGTTRLGVYIPIFDGSFVARFWSGLPTIATGIQVYDWLDRQFYSQVENIGVGAPALFYGQRLITPEVEWPDNGKIKFDLSAISQTSPTDGVLASQLVFTGVRRRANVISDPVPSSYKYYEKDYDIPYSLVINNYATTGGQFNPSFQITIPVNDFDFELRRIELALQSPQQTSQFKIQLYNTDWVKLSNLPVLSHLLMHTNPETNSGELSFWPAPPVLYRVNSVIRFDIYSLLVSPTALPQTFQLTFRGVRRIPC
jgi:hypothetical protein